MNTTSAMLATIGRTPMLELRRLLPAGHARVLFAGTSTGANVVAALRVAQRLGPGKTVLTLACDTGLKYLLADLYTGAA